MAKRRLRALKLHVPPGGRILEIGCGTGEFTRLAHEEGFDVEAVDLSESVCNYVRNELGIYCFNGKIEYLDSSRKDYNAIVAFDVIEHLPDPLSFLRHIIARISSRGIIFLEMPNWQCVEGRLFGHLWNMLNMRDHLNFFSKDALNYILGKMGLQTITILSHETYWEAPFAMVFALLNLLRINKLDCPQIVESDTIPKSIHKQNNTYFHKNLQPFLAQELPAMFTQIISPLTYPFRQAISYAGWGTELSVIARS
ncbi:MAG: class I SAM-dependent methyltransferase [Sedimentisphaerales bacterium]|nr:class I SAM-dependent methyltransferase [Sedimentisphaerales bacterium]